MNQILNNWGLGDEISKISSPIVQLTLLDGVSSSQFPEQATLTSDRENGRGTRTYRR